MWTTEDVAAVGVSLMSLMLIVKVMIEVEVGVVVVAQVANFDHHMYCIAIGCVGVLAKVRKIILKLKDRKSFLDCDGDDCCYC